MDDRIKINFHGTSEKMSTIRRYTNELNNSYALSYNVEDSFLNADGMGDPSANFLNIKVKVEDFFLNFLSGYLVKKAGEFIFKELIFQPFCDWLESIDTNEEIPPADYIIFEYDDIVIKLAYAKKNHQNAVSLVTLKLVKFVPKLGRMGLGNLTMVAAPVKYFMTEWKLYHPGKGFINDFLINWGLEYNDYNRCIFRLADETIIHQYWW